MLVPKLLTTLRDYSARQFRADLQAGIIVGIAALPLSPSRCATGSLP